MSRRQSRKRQRQLERELFGPEPKAMRPRRARAVSTTPVEPRPTTPGSCWACGNRCWPAYKPWTCPYCSVTYPVVDINSDGRV